MNEKGMVSSRAMIRAAAGGCQDKNLCFLHAQAVEESRIAL
jgi:hypothetical protein